MLERHFGIPQRLLPLFLLGVLTSLALIFVPFPVMDEAAHLKISKFCAGVLAGQNSLTDYIEDKPPLSFFIWAVVGKLSFWNLHALRLFGFGLSLWTLRLFKRICDRIEVRNAGYLVLFLFLMPKFLVNSSLLMTETLSLLFIFQSFVFFLDSKQSLAKLTISALLMACAVQTRQTIIGVALGVGLYELFQWRSHPFLKKLLRLLILTIPLWGLLVFVWYWGGLTSHVKRADIHTLAFTPRHFTMLMVVVGMYFAVLLKTTYFDRTRWDLLALLLVPLFFLFPIDDASMPYIWGIPTELARLVAKRLGVPGAAKGGLLVLYCLGALLSVRMVQRPRVGPPHRQLLFLIIVASLAISSIIVIVSDRYFIQIFPFFLLAFYRAEEPHLTVQYRWLQLMWLFSLGYCGYRVMVVGYRIMVLG